MPTIHIHLNSTTDVAEIVNHALRMYGVLTITIDQDGITKPSAPAESLVETIMGYEADKAAAKLMARKARNLDRYDWRVANYDRMISFDCGYCGAVAGKPCQRPDGTPFAAPTAHGPRVHALQEADKAVPVRTANQIIDRIVLDEV